MMSNYYNNFIKLPSFHILVLTLLISACSSVEVRTPVLKAANSSIPSQYKRIAVLPFTSHAKTDNIRSHIETTLASVTINGQPYFDVVERTRVNDLLKEIKLGTKGIIDRSNPKKISKLGKMVGANGVYTGTVNQNDTNDEKYTESRTKCTGYVQKSKHKSECVGYTTYKVNCKKRVAIYSLGVKLVDVEAGVIKYAQAFNGKAENKACSDSSRTLTGKGELLQIAQNEALNKFRKEVAPYIDTLVVTLLESTDNLKSDKAQEKFKSGLKFAEAQRMNRACEIWNDVSLFYNQGVCLEIDGDFVGALYLYNKADRLLNEPNELISMALKRVNNSSDEKQRLNNQLAY